MRTYYNDTGLIPADVVLPSARHTEDEALWSDVITAAAFLPRVQLYGGNSQAVQEGKIQVGRFGLVRNKDQIDDMSSTFDCLPLSWRFKAMRMPGDGNVFSYYDPRSKEFTDIIAASEEPDSGS